MGETACCLLSLPGFQARTGNIRHQLTTFKLQFLEKSNSAYAICLPSETYRNPHDSSLLFFPEQPLRPPTPLPSYTSHPLASIYSWQGCAWHGCLPHPHSSPFAHINSHWADMLCQQLCRERAEDESSDPRPFKKTSETNISVLGGSKHTEKGRQRDWGRGAESVWGPSRLYLGSTSPEVTAFAKSEKKLKWHIFIYSIKREGRK